MKESKTKYFVIPAKAGIQFLFLSLPLLAAPVTGKSAEPLPSVEIKSTAQDSGLEVLLSQNIEERVKDAVTSILPDAKFTVSAKVWTKKEQETKEIAPQSSGQNQQVEEDEEILPGIPRLMTSSGNGAKKQMSPAMIKLISRVSIQKVALKIFLDSGISDPFVDSVKKVASSAAGLDMARGDELSIEKIAFPRPEIVKKMWVSDFLLNPKYLWIAVGSIMGFLFLIFLFGPARSIARSYIQAMQVAALAKSEAKDSAGTAQGTVIPAQAGIQTGNQKNKQGELNETALETADLEMEEALAKASAEISGILETPSAPAKGRGTNGHRPFSFVTEKSLPNFMHLIQREPAPAISVAVHYLDPALGAQVLSSLNMETRTLVIQLLAKVQEREPEDVQILEAKVQARLHYVVGGEDKLRDLLSFADPELQPPLLSSVRAVNPALAEKVERTMVSMESLGNMEPAVVQAVIKQMGMKNFCPLMLTLTESLREKIATKLPGGQAQRVKEEIELSKPLSPVRFREERNRLIGILRKLQQEGILQV